jgi:Ran GTPase-activating protein (RanGAP) involved in mRNA processing and transport
MSIFNDKETEFLRKWGNEKVAKVWLHDLKKSGYDKPNFKDSYKLKEFMRAVYEQKRFYKKEESSSEEEDGEESESESEEEKEESKSKPKSTSNNKPLPNVHSQVDPLETNTQESTSTRSEAGGEDRTKEVSIDNRYNGR